MKLIKLTKGQVACVDNDDYKYLIKFRWYAQWDEDTKSFYAVTSKWEGMHRFILKAPKGVQVDHINGDTLDNQKENLRLVTNRQNQQNQHKVTSSKYPGVHWDKSRSKWLARIKLEGKSYHLGRFDDEREAFNAYLVACRVCGFAIDQMLSKHGR